MGSLPRAPFNDVQPRRRSSPGPPTRSCRSTMTPSTRSRRSTSAAVRSACRSPTPSGRYYVLQFVDAWTNNFAYVGHRATGTEAGTYLLVAPGWDGSPAANETVIRCPTDGGEHRRALGGRRRGRHPRRRRAAGAADAHPAPAAPAPRLPQPDPDGRRAAAPLRAAARLDAGVPARRSATWITSSASPRSACSMPDAPYTDPDPRSPPRCPPGSRRASSSWSTR